MKNLTTGGSAPAGPPVPFTDQLRLAVASYLARFKGVSRERPNPTCAATWPGAPNAAWTRWPPGGRAWSCRLRHLAEAAGIQIARAHPHMLRHTYVTTMLDAGADLRDVQIAARHADPRTTMRYDRARNNLDRHPNYILAAYMASGT